MGNKEIAQLFYLLADLLELQNIPWKPIAYRRAARIIESSGDEIEDIYSREGVEGLQEIEGIGKGIANGGAFEA